RHARQAKSGAVERAEERPVRVGRVAVNILLWWFLNVIFNLANKGAPPPLHTNRTLPARQPAHSASTLAPSPPPRQCLNSWPHPWALATLHQLIGSSCMLPLYLPLPSHEGWRPLRQFPRLAWSDLRSLLPIVSLLALGHVTSTLAPAYGTVAFSNIVKTAEPLFTCAFSFLLYRRVFPPSVYFSLLLVVAGVALVSTRDVNFSAFSLLAGMVSNAAFALYSIRAKRAMEASPSTLTPRATYALLTLCSCLMLAPLACVMELSGAGPSMLPSSPPAFKGARLGMLLLCTGLIQYLSNELAFCTLFLIHPVTYAVANTLKRSIVVGASLIFFGQRMPFSGMPPSLLNTTPSRAKPHPCTPTFSSTSGTQHKTGRSIGAALAIIGALLYSISMQGVQRT
ncbi:MAG: hypothetical protein SGPRY_006147, partial [Prymnesium sp.]